MQCLGEAECNRCALRHIHLAPPAPVPARECTPEASPRILLIGPSPSGVDTANGFPFSGGSVRTLWKTLGELGLNRLDVSITNEVACDLGYLPLVTLSHCRNAVKKRAQEVKAGADKELLLMPVRACRPRLRAEINRHDALLILGSGACSSILGEKLGTIGGAPWPAPESNVPDWLKGKQILATAHPRDCPEGSYAEEQMIREIKKGVRWANKIQTWRDPDARWFPEMEYLEALLQGWLSSPKDYAVPEFGDKPLIAFDYETTGTDGRNTRVRTCAVDDGKNALLLAWEDIDGTPVGTEAYRAAMTGWLKRVFESPRLIKVGWNSGGFDINVSETFILADTKNHIDAMILDRIAESEGKHSLWSAARKRLDIWPWKAEHAATKARNLTELGRYNLRDSRVTHLVARSIARDVQGQGATGHYARYAALQTMARNAERLGFLIDTKQIDRTLQTLHKNGDRARETWTSFAPGVNPNSPRQVGEFLYELMGLPILKMTDSGAPSTDGETIIQLCGFPGLSEEQRNGLLSLRGIRTADKLICLVEGWKPGTWSEDHGAWVVDPDGYAHPRFLVTGTATWRWASSGPIGNVQNIMRWLRACFRAAPGNLVYTADAEAVELRMISGLAGVQFYLDLCSRTDLDVHNATMLRIMGEEFCMALQGAPTKLSDKGTDAWALLRDLFKRTTYHVFFVGEAGSLLGVLHEVETIDENGRITFPYANKELEEVRAMIASWRRLVPELSHPTWGWWQEQVTNHASLGYTVDPIWGLRRHVRRGEKNLKNLLANTPVQSGAEAMIHIGALTLFHGKDNVEPLLPFDFDNNEGFIHQGHDSVSYMGPVRDYDATVAILKNTLERKGERRFPGIPVDFPFEVKVSPHWVPPRCPAEITRNGVRMECGRDTKWTQIERKYACKCGAAMNAEGELLHVDR